MTKGTMAEIQKRLLMRQNKRIDSVLAQQNETSTKIRREPPVAVEVSTGKPAVVGKNSRIPRPMNSFMVFSNLQRKKLAREYPDLHNTVLSRMLGRVWRSLGIDEKQTYVDEAERLRSIHMQTYPNYKYCPRKGKKKVPSSDTSSTVESSPAPFPSTSSCGLETVQPVSGLEADQIKVARVEKKFSFSTSTMDISTATSPDSRRFETGKSDPGPTTSAGSTTAVINYSPLTPERSPLKSSSVDFFPACFSPIINLGLVKDFNHDSAYECGVGAEDLLNSVFVLPGAFNVDLTLARDCCEVPGEELDRYLFFCGRGLQQ